MSRSKVTINLATSGLGQVSTNMDAVCGMQFYGTAPGSFATTACQAVYSLNDAVSKGITNDYSDETAATGSLVISSVGSTGDVITITISEAVPVSSTYPTGTKTVTLCSYAQTSSDTTATLLAASIAAAINARTYLTATSTLAGYTASASTGTITFTARGGLGKNLNSVSVTATVTGTIATGTNTAFSGGVNSKKAIWYYNVSEYFRLNPNGKLWVQFTSSVGAAYSELATLQSVANGECRRIGVLNFTARSVSQITADGTLLQAVAASSYSGYTPFEVIYAPNTYGIADITTVQNQQAQSNKNVSVLIGADGGALGYQLYLNSKQSVPALGAVLGRSAAIAVSQNMGEIGIGSMSDGVELAVPAFSNGQLVSAIASSALDTLEDYRYVFFTTLPAYSGVYINNDYTCVNTTSDYNRLCRNLVINKTVRNSYQGIVPLLKSRILLNADGTISQIAISQWKSALTPFLNGMKSDGDISDFGVDISSTQNVLSTNTVAVTVKILPVGIADYITINLGFVPKL